MTRSFSVRVASLATRGVSQKNTSTVPNLDLARSVRPRIEIIRAMIGDGRSTSDRSAERTSEPLGRPEVLSRAVRALAHIKVWSPSRRRTKSGPRAERPLSGMVVALGWSARVLDGSSVLAFVPPAAGLRPSVSGHSR